MMGFIVPLFKLPPNINFIVWISYRKGNNIHQLYEILVGLVYAYTIYLISGGFICLKKNLNKSRIVPKKKGVA